MGDEFKHITKVMRHKNGDELYVTDGRGLIVKGILTDMEKGLAVIEAVKILRYQNNLKNITFCIPKLKNPNRFEFALEKCTELGITNIIVYESSRSVAKGSKKERWEKILLSAMKQSLRSYLPRLYTAASFGDLLKNEGKKIIFDQNSEQKFTDFQNDKNIDYYFIFGPEGGLSRQEIEAVVPADVYNLSENRLRSETAIIKCASMLG